MAEDNMTANARDDDELAQEIDHLKREFANLKAAIAERAQDVVDGVEERASRATEALRAQAGVVRDNPGTISTAFVLGGIMGILLGMALSNWEQPPRRWYERR